MPLPGYRTFDWLNNPEFGTADVLEPLAEGEPMLLQGTGASFLECMELAAANDYTFMVSSMKIRLTAKIPVWQSSPGGEGDEMSYAFPVEVVELFSP